MNGRPFPFHVASLAVATALAFSSAPLAEGAETPPQARLHGIALAGLGVDAPPDVTGFQFGLHCMARDLDGMQLGIGASAENASGVQLGLATSIASGRLRGIQSALAVSGAEQGMSGLQLAFFRTSAGNHGVADKRGKGTGPARETVSRGLQLALCGAYAEHLEGVQISFWDAEARDLDGVQIGILHTAGRLDGLQAGLWNCAGVKGKAARGIQAGLVNSSGNFTGLQLGVVNLAKELKGLQLGVVNWAGSSPVPFLPLLNASF